MKNRGDKCDQCGALINRRDGICQECLDGHLDAVCGEMAEFIMTDGKVTCYCCGESVEPEDDRRGCGCHCPECQTTL